MWKDWVDIHDGEAGWHEAMVVAGLRGVSIDPDTYSDCVASNPSNLSIFGNKLI